MKKYFWAILILAGLASCKTVYLVPQSGGENRLTLIRCSYPYLCSSMFWEELSCTANPDGTLACTNMTPSYSYK